MMKVARTLGGILMLAMPSVAPMAAQPDIWFAPPDPFARAERWREFRKDYLELFSPSAAWSGVAGKAAAFKVSPSFVDLAPEDVQRRVIGDLARRVLALSWEMGPVPPGPNCGAGTEGYAGDTARSVQRIKAAGGQLRFVAMDEPFWYAHYAKTDHSCHYSIDDLARGVADRLQMVWSVFPDAQVGDIEPIGNPTDGDYVSQIAQWAQAFQAATHRKLAFIHADVNWNGRWKEQLRELEGVTRQASIPLGVIINGDAHATSDEDWSSAAIRHEQEVLDISGVIPQTLIFQSWDHYPLRLLPETDHQTMAGIALEGSQPPARATISTNGANIVARVSDPSGKPLAGTPVNVTARDVNGVSEPRPKTLGGVVPANAATARFVLRAGVECTCSGPIDIDVGELAFRSSEDGIIHRRLGSGTGFYHLKDANPKVAINTDPFPVHGGEKYDVVMPIRVREQASRPGYIALIFFDSKGAELRRDVFELTAPNEGIAASTTNANGTLSVPAKQAGNINHFVVDVQVAGTPNTRPTIIESKPDTGSR